MCPQTARHLSGAGSARQAWTEYFFCKKNHRLNSCLLVFASTHFCSGLLPESSRSRLPPRFRFGTTTAAIGPLFSPTLTPSRVEVNAAALPCQSHSFRSASGVAAQVAFEKTCEALWMAGAPTGGARLSVYLGFEQKKRRTECSKIRF